MTDRGVNTHAWIDASAGVAGDMLLGALIDVGADLSAVQRAVDALVPRAIRLDTRVVRRAGLRATKLQVEVLLDDPPHRTWASIEAMIGAAELPDPVRRNSLAVFERLAMAEARAHGIDVVDVHFHEVGALDSIADVVGVCAALHNLGVGSVSAGSVAVGSGRIRTAHGEIPVPVPAVVELAVGWPILAGGAGELATPTGMALISTLATSSAAMPAMTVRSVGCGAGTKDPPDRPNVTRVMIGDVFGAASAAENSGSAAGLILEANVDDLDPRLWPGVLSALLAAGASDAWLVPILMKKGRPAHTLTVLCQPTSADLLRDEIFRSTTTLGIRSHAVDKIALGRGFVDVTVGEDSIAVKVAHRGGRIVQATPEFDDVVAVARRRDLAQRVVLDRANAAAAAAALVDGADVPSDLRD